VFGRPGTRFEEGQLGAQEADALRAGLQPGRHLGGGGGVAEQRHDPAVAGDRRKPPCCDSLLAQLPATVHFALGTEKLARPRVDDQSAHGADAELANVGGAGGQERIRNRCQQVGMTCGCLPKGSDGAELGPEPFDLQSEGGILDHQLVRLENLGLVLETGATEAFGASRELGRDGVESGNWVARACRGRLFVLPDEGAANRDPAGGGEPAELALAHFSAETVRARAPRMSVVEVAPGSWCPMLRSPSYDARPFEAWRGTVARIPSSLASNA